MSHTYQYPKHIIAPSGDTLRIESYGDPSSCSEMIQISGIDGTTTHIIPMYDKFLRHNETEADALKYALAAREKIIKNSPTFVNPGPTNDELRRYPAIKEAWEELCVVRALCGHQFDK